MNRPYVSADDIHNLFHTPQKPRRRALSWQTISGGFLIVLAVLAFINGPAIYQQLTYWWENDIQKAQQVNRPTLPNPLPTTEGQTAVQPNDSIDTAAISDNSIFIPKIKVNAPVIWDVTGGSDLNTDMLNALRNGVVRYPQTALPNQVGNVFLTGHSSNYWWDKGRYKTVFALLDKLVVGDLVYVKYQGTVYTYRVNAQKVVKPTETSVLDPTNKPVLSLMTCTPTGTALYRRIVTADLISPSSGLASQPTTPDTKSLNAVR